MTDSLTEPSNTEVMEPEEGEVAEERKPIKQSRWVAKSNVARYDKRTLDTFGQCREPDGWRHGAKIQKVKSK